MKIIIEINDDVVIKIVRENTDIEGNVIDTTNTSYLPMKDAYNNFMSKDTGPARINHDTILNLELDNPFTDSIADITAGAAPELP